MDAPGWNGDDDRDTLDPSYEDDYCPYCGAGPKEECSEECSRMWAAIWGELCRKVNAK